jgi:hypothetical protein
MATRKQKKRETPIERVVRAFLAREAAQAGDYNTDGKVLRFQQSREAWHGKGGIRVDLRAVGGGSRRMLPVLCRALGTTIETFEKRERLKHVRDQIIELGDELGVKRRAVIALIGEPEPDQITLGIPRR